MPDNILEGLGGAPVVQFSVFLENKVGRLSDFTRLLKNNSILGHAIERTRGARGRALELVSLLPLAAPALLFSIGVIAVWNHDATARLYDSLWMGPMLLVGRFTVFAALVCAGAVASLDPRQEEAALLAGARPARRLFSVVAPPLRGALAGSFVLVFTFSMRDLDSAILVRSRPILYNS